MPRGERAICHDCDCQEGQFHSPGCDMEQCPFCGGQLISCDCACRILGIDHSEGTRAWHHGLTPEQDREWAEKLAEKGRVPYIRWPNLCAYCGELWPEMFVVPDDEWKKFIQADMRDKMICRPCYDWIREVQTAAPR